MSQEKKGIEVVNCYSSKGLLQFYAELAASCCWETPHSNTY